MRTPSLFLLLLLSAVGCRQHDKETGTDEPIEDADGDGFNNLDDCDDTNADINPYAYEVCGDQLDNDCDGFVDEDDAQDATEWYFDFDGDGYGDPNNYTVACDKSEEGYVENNDDCNDYDAAYNPAATEPDCNDPNDYNCDGVVGAQDTDGDGYLACGDNADCNDTNPGINPGMQELCDWELHPGLDENCDGYFNTWPNGTTDAVKLAGGAVTWYIDADADTFGNMAYSQTSCPDEDPALVPDWTPDGYVVNADDCDDGDADINPLATEICDEQDNDCDGLVDDDDTSLDLASAPSWYLDADLDAYGDSLSSAQACLAPEGYVADGTDCYDENAAVNPGADEYCNGYDDDCDGSIDESDAVDRETWYIDYDRDGYGSPSYTQHACIDPTNPDESPIDGYVANSEDCNDTDATVNPAAEEYCNGEDDNCDGTIDEDDSVDVIIWYQDLDGDGYGNGDIVDVSCEQPDGYVEASSDCNDDNDAINPSAVESCNRVDDNCDGNVDENSGDAVTWYLDTDGDGYGVSTTTIIDCDQPTGYAEASGDCDDTNASISPGAAEYCDAEDNDCDGQTDESNSLDALTWYADSDGDLYGNGSSPKKGCTQPAAYVADASDCNDSDDSVNPGADEICNDSIDNNCDGSASECVLSLSNADLRFLGTSTQDGAGFAMADVGDVDGDGSQDIFLSAYLSDRNVTDGGAAYLFYGPFTAGGDISFADADAIYAGVSGDDRAGNGLAGGIDVTNDGIVDLAVAAIREDTGGTNAGAVYIIEGPITAGTDTTLADGIKIVVGTGYSTAGYVQMIDDFTGDSYADVLVGAPSRDANGKDSGAIYIVSGPITAGRTLSTSAVQIIGEAAENQVGGGGFTPGHDMNGDGHTDLLVGCRRDDTVAADAGAAYVLYGPVTNTTYLSSSTDVKVYGVASSDLAGYRTHGPGDVDGDGYADMLVTATASDSAATDGGAVYLLYGPVTATSLANADVIIFGDDNDGKLGSSVDMTDDMDGDGHIDLLVGASAAAGVAEGGAAYLFYGPLTDSLVTSDANHMFFGDAFEDFAGDSVNLMGDVDGMGNPGILVTAYGSDMSAVDAGAVTLTYVLGL